MKNRIAKIRLFLGSILLFAILFQSWHSAVHLAESISEKHCSHKYAEGKNEVGHSHHDFEKCFSCEFTFSQFTTSETLSFLSARPIYQATAAFASPEANIAFFRGSLFCLRGPPSSVV
ncbi:MAG TPA: hypothetical protein VGB50_08215 [Flavobacterium sp.]|jgi:hypothetical protein